MEGALMNYKLDHFRTMGDQLSGWKIKKFADKLKDMVCLLIGCSREQLEDRDFKEVPLGEEWIQYGYADSFSKVYKDGEETIIMNSVFCSKEKYEEERRVNWQTAYKRELTPRLLMQLMGTECCRNIIHPNCWVNALMSEYRDTVDFDKNIVPNKNWIITDTRFPNEYKAIKDKGGICIKITRKVREFIPGFITEYNPLLDGKEHESETALDYISDWDYVINNDGTIEELVEKVRTILVNEKII